MTARRLTADDVIFTLTLCNNSEVGCTYGGGISGISGRPGVQGRHGGRRSAASPPRTR